MDYSSRTWSPEILTERDGTNKQISNRENEDTTEPFHNTLSNNIQQETTKVKPLTRYILADGASALPYAHGEDPEGTS